MRYQRIFGLATALLLQSCTSVALRNETVDQGETFRDFMYTMVLDNVAQQKAHPGSLPWHLKLTQGITGITDTAGATLGITWSPISRNGTVSGNRSWNDTWTTAPVLDSKQLNLLLGIYRSAGNDAGGEDSYIKVGTPADSSCAHGHSYHIDVWVHCSDVQKLTDLVLKVLETAPTSPGDRGLLAIPAR